MATLPRRMPSTAMPPSPRSPAHVAAPQQPHIPHAFSRRDPPQKRSFNPAVDGDRGNNPCRGAGVCGQASVRDFGTNVNRAAAQ